MAEETQNESTPESAPETAQIVTDADEWLGEFAPEVEVVVHETVFTHPETGKCSTFLVKEFDQSDLLEMAIGPLTFLNNQYVKQPKQEAKLSVALKVHHGIVRPTGDAKNPYVPLFTLGHINKMYRGRKRGDLLDWLCCKSIALIRDRIRAQKKRR